MTASVDISALVDGLYGAEVSGIALSELVDDVLSEDLTRYQTSLVGFCQDILGMTPWSGELSPASWKCCRRCRPA